MQRVAAQRLGDLRGLRDRAVAVCLRNDVLRAREHGYGARLVGHARSELGAAYMPYGRTTMTRPMTMPISDETSSRKGWYHLQVARGERTNADGGDHPREAVALPDVSGNSNNLLLRATSRQNGRDRHGDEERAEDTREESAIAPSCQGRASAFTTISTVATATTCRACSRAQDRRSRSPRRPRSMRWRRYRKISQDGPRAELRSSRATWSETA